MAARSPHRKPGVVADQWCSTIPPGFGHPPVNVTIPVLQVLQRSVEPVPATDGLIHLAYTAQVTNTTAQPVQIVSVVPVDPLAGFSPTGRNLIKDLQGRDVAGKVKLFVTSPDDTLPSDPEEPEPMPGFSTSVPAGNSGVMFFDVTYTAPDQVPSLLAHAITASPEGGGPGTPSFRQLTNPVPVGCLKLAVLHPPLVGHGWIAFEGCCTFAAYHRDTVEPINGLLQPGQQFAIDFEQAGPNNACCTGRPRPCAPGGATTRRSWRRLPAWSSPSWTAYRTRSPCSRLSPGPPSRTWPAIGSSRTSAAAGTSPTRTSSPARSQPRSARAHA